MEGFLIILAVIIYWVAKSAKANAKNQKSEQKRNVPAAPVKLPSQVAPKLTNAANERREQMRSSAQWHEAKRRQDDAEQLHSIKMDTCESKLESLRVLYDAGILDREEYAQRVARVKAGHRSAGQ